MSSSDASSLPTIELICLFVETLIFGAFAVLYSIAVWLLIGGRTDRRRPRSRACLWMLGTSTTMFVLALAHVVCDVHRAVKGLIVGSRTLDGAEQFYGTLSETTQVLKSILYVVQTLVGDAFVIYRLHVIWNRSVSIIVLPAVLLAGTCITGLIACQHMTRIEGLGVIFAQTLAPWITSFFALSLTTNVLAAGERAFAQVIFMKALTFVRNTLPVLISGRIIWSNYNMRKYRAGYPGAVVANWGVVELVVQSAAIYTCVLILLLGTYLSGSNVQYIFRDALQPSLIGFVFTLIIIRVRLRDATTSSSGEMATARGGSGSDPTSNRGQDRRLYPLRPVAINVSVSQTHDRSSFERYHGKDGHAHNGLSTLENGQEL
uniref:N/A n=1 Tax=Ganoderma boninense TaxID=34458 RepID=A0A5K1JXU5_9APHY|nr:N/A [Ganoderma boninense]